MMDLVDVLLFGIIVMILIDFVGPFSGDSEYDWVEFSMEFCDTDDETEKSDLPPIQRYDILDMWQMQESDDGEFVAYEDHVEVVGALLDLTKTLREEADQARRELGDLHGDYIPFSEYIK